MFATEGQFDHVTIDGQEYSGIAEIDQIIDGSFSVAFSSDGSITSSGFVLEWECFVPMEGRGIIS